MTGYFLQLEQVFARDLSGSAFIGPDYDREIHALYDVLLHFDW